MKKPKAAALADPECLHCRIIKMIEADHPSGMDSDDAAEVLRCIAIIAGDILANAGDASLSGFMSIVMMVRAKGPHQITIVQGTRH